MKVEGRGNRDKKGQWGSDGACGEPRRGLLVYGSQPVFRARRFVRKHEQRQASSRSTTVPEAHFA